MQQLTEILGKYDFVKLLNDPTETIEALESKFECELPEDYKYFLNNYTEYWGFVGPAYVNLWDINNLWKQNEGYEIKQWLDNIIGIGSNGGGECIAIELLDAGNYRIVLTPFLFEEECHIEIGASFTDMLIRLDNGKEWFG